MLLNPSAINPDGFAVMCADTNNKLIYKNLILEGAELTLQNGLMSWLYLAPNFWANDLPCKNVSFDGGDTVVEGLGIKRLKKQRVKYPSSEDPDPIHLVKTELGDGQIEKLSVNLSSRMNTLTLKYDTE